MEITTRFPPDLGNLAHPARFPHFHSRFSLFRGKNKDTNTGDGTLDACRQIER